VRALPRYGIARAGPSICLPAIRGASSSCERPNSNAYLARAASLKIQFQNNEAPSQCQGSHATIAWLGRASWPAAHKEPIPGKPGTGAQFVSFNFRNPLICPLASSPSAFNALTPASRRAHSLKVVVAIGAIMAAATYAARLEISVRSRRGTDRCDRASRSAPRRHGRNAGRASPRFPTGTTSAVLRVTPNAGRSAAAFCNQTLGH